MNEIKYLSGHDVREPVGEGRKIIGHCCNSEGKMGAGVALALLKKWPSVRSKYISWHKSNNHLGHPFALGKVQFVFVEEDIVVANIIGQHGLRINKETGEVPVRYEALRDGCIYIRGACEYYKASAHFPYLMGCDLAGGDWAEVEKIIQEELLDHGIEVTAYDLFYKRDSATSE
jgi:hypothetical protein